MGKMEAKWEKKENEGKKRKLKRFRYFFRVIQTYPEDVNKVSLSYFALISEHIKFHWYVVVF